MPTVTLVARGIAGLEVPQKGRQEYFDKSTPGFGLRVTSGGHRSWICLYRHKGEKRRFTIGPYPQLGLADARERAREVLRRAAKGEDPAADKKRERKAETIRELAERYLEEYAKEKKTVVARRPQYPSQGPDTALRLPEGNRDHPTRRPRHAPGDQGPRRRDPKQSHPRNHSETIQLGD